MWRLTWRLVEIVDDDGGLVGSGRVVEVVVHVLLHAGGRHGGYGGNHFVPRGEFLLLIHGRGAHGLWGAVDRAADRLV